VDLEPTDDQVALQSELRRLLADRVSPEARRAVAELPGAVDRHLWRELAGMGIFTLALPESEGGVGLGLAEAALVFEELGRAAVPGPLIGTFLAAGLVAAEGRLAAAARPSSSTRGPSTPCWWWAPRAWGWSSPRRRPGPPTDPSTR
jgi:alkylation response protein AidB-like acyl-CoA dehydrogenase